MCHPLRPLKGEPGVKKHKLFSKKLP